MSHVVTNWQWAWRTGDPETVMNWCGELSEKGYELKGLTSSTSPQTQPNGVNIWSTVVCAFMQRPIYVTTNLQSWNFPD
jgi:hypothetical protein